MTSAGICQKGDPVCLRSAMVFDVSCVVVKEKCVQQRASLSTSDPQADECRQVNAKSLDICTRGRAYHNPGEGALISEKRC